MHARVAIAFVALAVAGCGSSKTCQTTTCSTGTAKSFQQCMDTSADTTVWNYGGMSCTCSGGDVSTCQSCSNKVSAWCQSTSNCSLVGNFAGKLASGTQATLAAIGSIADGSYTLTAGTTTANGNYVLNGASLTLTNTTAECMQMPAVYNLTWDASCAHVSFAKASDACTGRTADVDGATLARQ